jgi:hypothetical protein
LYCFTRRLRRLFFSTELFFDMEPLSGVRV